MLTAPDFSAMTLSVTAKVSGPQTLMTLIAPEPDVAQAQMVSSIYFKTDYFACEAGMRVR